MWLFTRNGFYSVVRDKADARHVQVRARIENDLEKLTSFVRNAVGVELPTIISTPNADYAYRIVIEQSLWVRIASALAGDVNYTNFKDEVHGEDDRDAAYMRIWSAMNDLQRKRKRNGGSSS
jgi:hypothetical protein